MKKHVRPLLVWFSLSLILSCESVPPPEKNVLFVGNSLTYFHDMPTMLQQMLNVAHPHIKIEQITFPGAQFHTHMSYFVESQTDNGAHSRRKHEGGYTLTEVKLAEKAWDIVILQTGGSGVMVPEFREKKVLPPILRMKELVPNADCQFLLFQTWPSVTEYPRQICYSSSVIDLSPPPQKFCSETIPDMPTAAQLLQLAYETTSKAAELELTRHGELFYQVHTHYPDIKLYDDAFHPSPYGAYLNASIFYRMLTTAAIPEVVSPDTLEEDLCRKIREIVDSMD
ncbi:MAG: DUF4886 domain-containing protein [Bacteroidota bacterium]